MRWVQSTAACPAAQLSGSHLEQGARLTGVAAQRAQRSIQHRLPPHAQRGHALRLQVQRSVKLVCRQAEQPPRLAFLACDGRNKMNKNLGLSDTPEIGLMLDTQQRTSAAPVGHPAPNLRRAPCPPAAR